MKVSKRIRKPRINLFIARSISCLLLICIFTLPTQAMANIWNLPNGLLDLFENNASYSGYTAGSRDEKTRKGTPSRLAVFIMTSAKHDELFICRESSNRSWEIEAQSTIAVYQPIKEENLYPTIEIFDDVTFRISYLSTPIKETFDFLYQDEQWFLSSAEISSSSETLICQRTDEGLVFQTLSGLSYVVSDISLFDFNISRFPKSEEQLEAWQNAFQEITSDLPCAIRIEDTSRGTLPVYSGPGKGSYIAANNKAAIALKEPYWIYGIHDGWTMVEYDINVNNSRIGWVENPSLHTSVPSIDWIPVVAVTRSPALFTDDPHVGQVPITNLSENSTVEILTCLKPWWAYVSVVMNNTLYYGFIPLDCLEF